jgi:hypothetical protein
LWTTSAEDYEKALPNSTITDGLMRTDDPLFAPINNDFGVAMSYLAYAKKSTLKGKA